MKNKIKLNYNFQYSGLIIFFIGAISSFGFAPFHFFPVTIFCYVLLIHFFIIKRKELKFEKLCQDAGINGIKGHRSVGGYRASIYNAMSIDSVTILVNIMK